MKQFHSDDAAAEVVIPKPAGLSPREEAVYQKARSLFGAEFAEVILDHAKTHEEQLQLLRRALDAGKSSKARGIQDLILKGPVSPTLNFLRFGPSFRAKSGDAHASSLVQAT